MNAPIKNELVEFVKTEFERYQSELAPRFEKCRRYIEHCECVPPPRDLKWQNQVAVPITFEGLQTISPRLFTAMFPNEAPVDVIVEGNESPLQGIKIKYLLQHYFRVANVQGHFSPALDQCTLLGTSYIEGGTWHIKYGYQVNDRGERYNAIIESRPDCKFVDFFEIFPHPSKLTMDDGLPLIRRQVCDSEYLKGLSNNPFFKFENLKDALKTDFPEPKADRKKGEEYELLHYWGPWKKNFDKTRLDIEEGVPWWAIVINRKTLVRSIPNPYNHQIPPYLKLILFNSQKPSWFGTGIGQVGASTQERLNKLVNQRLDNVDLVLNRQGLYDGNDPLIDINDLKVSKPGKFRRCTNTTTSIKWMDIPDVTASSYKEEELAKQDYRNSTGAAGYLSPTDVSDQHRTAMGIQLLQGAAGTKFRPILRMLEISGIHQLAMFFFSNLRQFMTNDEWVIITGENGTSAPIQVTPEDIQAKVFFIPTGISETMNKEIQLQQLLRYKEVTKDDPTVNRQEINKRIAELFGFKDIQKLLTPIHLPQSGALDAQKQLQIQQRVAEGASRDQIKAEMLGPTPQVPQGVPAGGGVQGGQGQMGRR